MAEPNTATVLLVSAQPLMLKGPCAPLEDEAGISGAGPRGGH